ncbi:MAG: hypothetical protein M0R03_17700 [Novosphingobium sp.]|nr:hypothetical protein [Novosphingobium sp.]
MIIHPDLAALRDDDTPQRLAQDYLAGLRDGWRQSAAAAAILADLAAFDTSRPLADYPALASLFGSDGGAQTRCFTGSFVAAMARGLGEAPLGHVPVRHFTDGVMSMLMLARHGNVTLSLVAMDGRGLARRPRPSTVSFAPMESWEHVLAGTGTAELVERGAVTSERADLRSRDIVLRPGETIRCDGGRQALVVRDVEGCLVTLRLQRRRKGADVACEYRLADGALVHQAAGNPRDSRIETMLALLGGMNRADAAPHAAAIVLGEGSDGLRWQALRECLALDTLAGFTALRELADRDGDTLAAPARSLRDRLTAAYPQLAGVSPCPV